MDPAAVISGFDLFGCEAHVEHPQEAGDGADLLHVGSGEHARDSPVVVAHQQARRLEGESGGHRWVLGRVVDHAGELTPLFGAERRDDLADDDRSVLGRPHEESPPLQGLGQGAGRIPGEVQTRDESAHQLIDPVGVCGGLLWLDEIADDPGGGACECAGRDRGGEGGGEGRFLLGHGQCLLFLLWVTSLYTFTNMQRGHPQPDTTLSKDYPERINSIDMPRNLNNIRLLFNYNIF